MQETNKLRDGLTKSEANNVILMFVFLFMMFVCASLQFLTSKNLDVLTIVVLLATWLWTFLAKDALPSSMNSEDKEKRKLFYLIMAVWITVLGAFAITDSLFSMIAKGNGLLKLASLICLLIYVVLGLTATFSKGSAVRTTLMQFSIYTGNVEDEVEPGAVVLGREMNVETGEVSNKKAILHYVDRFVHMIIYGPTGSGKTSLMLSPMAYQDLQNPELGVVVLEPKGDFAEKVYAWARHLGRPATKVTYFNPTLPKCPYFNPLMCAPGSEADMVENLVTAFAAVDTTSSSYFRDNNEMLLRNALWTVKRLYGNDATFNHVLELMDNLEGKGAQMMKDLHAMKFKDPLTMADNAKIYSYFTQDYFPGIKGGKNAGKTYSDSSAIRTQIKKLVSNPTLARVLIPPKSSELKEGEYVDFDRVLRDGEVLCLCSAQGALRELGTYLGYFLILTLQSSVFKRPGNEKTRRGCMLYIDEFQKYANGSMADLLTQGRSYRVACIFATQNRALINNGGESGKQFLENVSTNCRNIVVFPGASEVDAKYFSNEFGTHIVEKTKESYSNRAYVPKFVGFDSARVTTSVDSKEEARFSPSTIMYQPFHRVFIRLVNKNSVSPAVAIWSDFVDRKVDDESQKFLDEIKTPVEQESVAKGLSDDAIVGLFDDEEMPQERKRDDDDVLWDLFEDDGSEESFEGSQRDDEGMKKSEDDDDAHDNAVLEDNDNEDFNEMEEVVEDI